VNKGQTIFSQIMEYVPRYSFDSYVKNYRGNYKVQSFTYWESRQVGIMTFAQLTTENL